MPEWLGISDMSNISHTLVNQGTVFQRFGSIQLPSLGNNSKQNIHAELKMVVTVNDVIVHFCSKMSCFIDP